MRARLFHLILIFLMSALLVHAEEHVVLLHGLIRSASSMDKVARSLETEGYTVHNIDYPSTKDRIETLAADLHQRILRQTEGAAKIHFVTHSMGGILVRHIQKSTPLPNIGRVVMLAPPNQGSEVVDKIGQTWAFKKLNGPAGQQLGTSPEGFIAQLGPVDFDCAVITGDRSINWINSCLIPGPDDGKVSLQSARVDGMRAYKVVHATHPMIMKNGNVIRETKHYLQHGSFTKP